MADSFDRVVHYSLLGCSTRLRGHGRRTSGIFGIVGQVSCALCTRCQLGVSNCAVRCQAQYRLPNVLTFSREPREDSFGTWIFDARGLTAATWSYASSLRDPAFFLRLILGPLERAHVVYLHSGAFKTSFNFVSGFFVTLRFV